MANRAVRQAIAARDSGDRRLANIYFRAAQRAVDRYLAISKDRLP